MRAGETAPGSGKSWRAWPGRRLVWPAALVASALFFTWAVAQFYQPGVGFSALISIGDGLDDSKIAALREVPHYVHAGSVGYDGAYYVQLALTPALDDPELANAIDNLPYRARRILFSWGSWLLGLGQPAWIVQAHALLNVGCWFGLGVVLLHWFPATSGQNFLRWAGVMFSQGVTMSVRNSLVDLPSLLLVALALRWIESQKSCRGGALLALAGLGKETSLLGAAALWDARAWRSPRMWLRFGAAVVALAVPLAVWMGYIRLQFGPTGDSGLNNFTAPLAGLAEKWATVVVELFAQPRPVLAFATAAATLAITVQFLFLVTRWRPADVWWRVGVAFAGMMVFLSTPVWEGYPGAFLRVLLPMTLAFNILVPRGRRWLPLLLAGNLSVLATPVELTAPARDFLHVSGRPELVAAVKVSPADGWYGAENLGRDRWRWTAGDAALRVDNAAGTAVRFEMRGSLRAVERQRVTIAAGGRDVWSGEVGGERSGFEFELVLPPGESRLEFRPGVPARRVGEDPRRLGVCVFNLEIGIEPVSLPKRAQTNQNSAARKP